MKQDTYEALNTRPKKQSNQVFQEYATKSFILYSSFLYNKLVIIIIITMASSGNVEQQREWTSKKDHYDNSKAQQTSGQQEEFILNSPSVQVELAKSVPAAPAVAVEKTIGMSAPCSANSLEPQQNSVHPTDSMAVIDLYHQNLFRQLVLPAVAAAAASAVAAIQVELATARQGANLKRTSESGLTHRFINKGATNGAEETVKKRIRRRRKRRCRRRGKKRPTGEGTEQTGAS